MGRFAARHGPADLVGLAAVGLSLAGTGSAYELRPMRRFDPRAVGRFECRAWETYYRRKWARS